jgi:hypothetical protein
MSARTGSSSGITNGKRISKPGSARGNRAMPTIPSPVAAPAAPVIVFAVFSSIAK